MPVKYSSLFGKYFERFVSGHVVCLRESVEQALNVSQFTLVCVLFAACSLRPRSTAIFLFRGLNHSARRWNYLHKKSKRRSRRPSTSAYPSPRKKSPQKTRRPSQSLSESQNRIFLIPQSSINNSQHYSMLIKQI